MKKGIDYVGVGVGAVIRDKEGKFFLAKRGPKAKNEHGRWEFPGGGVEFGETMEETIIREIKEEFDFDIEPLEPFLPVNHLIPREKQHWLAIPYLCRYKRGIPRIGEPDKCSEIGWLSLPEIKNKPLTIATSQSINQVIQRFG
jgi:mutator protein MutT